MRSTILTLLLLLPSVAAAQLAAPITYNEGPGIRLSDSLVLHPGLAIEMRYDSNVLLIDQSGRKGAPFLRLVGHLELSTRSPQRRADATTGKVATQRLEFRLGAAAAYREYFSGDDRVVQQRAVEVDAGLLLGYAPSRHFRISLRDAYQRQVTPANTLLLSNASTSTVISRDVNRLNLGLGLAPGGGRLSFSVGYALNIDAFEQAAFASASRAFHEVYLKGKWRLLPKTALMLDVIQQFYHYYNDDAGVRVGSKPFRVFLGFGGLFTPRFGAVVKVGYGNGLYDSGNSFNSVLVRTQLTYRFSPVARVAVGYDRSFSDSVYGNYFADHLVYARYNHQIASRFLLGLTAEYRFRTYDGVSQEQGVTQDQFDAHILSAGLSFDWQIRDWVYVGVGYNIQLQELNDPPSVNDVAGLLNFVAHQVLGRVGLSY